MVWNLNEDHNPESIWRTRALGNDDEVAVRQAGPGKGEGFLSGVALARVWWE